MTNVSEWSTTAATNNTAPPDGWPENMLPGKVNDCGREVMAAVARWYQDQNASLTTAGTSTAYTLATNSSYASLTDTPVLGFRIHTANAGAATLNVDGLGAKPLRKNANLDDYALGELVSGQTVIAAYNVSTDDFEVVGPAIDNPVAVDIVPTGTAMLFVQTAAPTGWTKGATHDNKALRVVTGTASSGGSSSFTSVFTTRTIAIANLPAHDHGAGTFAVGSHTHGAGSYEVNGAQEGTNVAPTGGSGKQYATNTNLSVSGTSGATVPTFAGTSGSTGSGTAMDFAVQYVDVIMATKD